MTFDLLKPCAAKYFGLWLVEPEWFAKAVAAVKDGTLKPTEIKAQRGESDSDFFTLDKNGLAMISIVGEMQKGESKFGGTSTLRVRQALRRAVRNEDVEGILLVVDSPGGLLGGTQELADEVRATAEQKPLRVHIDDMGASAALWVAVQGPMVTANATAQIGSIGVFTVLEDSSQMAEMAGLKVHVISTGSFKGAGVPGTEITDEQIAEVQELVDDVNEFFLKAVMKGRGLSRSKVQAMADGRVFLAAKAKELGLIDKVMSLDAAIEGFEKVLGKNGRKRASRDRGRRTSLAEASVRVAVGQADSG